MNKHLIKLIEGINNKDVYTRIKEKLNQGLKENRLIYTQNLRCIGKTKALIEFAKENNLTVIEPCITNFFVKEYNYKNIVSNNINIIKGMNINQVVVDEGVFNIKELETKNIKILTGFTNSKDIFTYNKKENSNSIKIYSDDDVISKLNLEINKLCKMLDVHTNFDQYKMIINNLRSTIEARRDIFKYPNRNVDELNKEDK